MIIYLHRSFLIILYLILILFFMTGPILLFRFSIFLCSFIIFIENSFLFSFIVKYFLNSFLIINSYSCFELVYFPLKRLSLLILFRYFFLFKIMFCNENLNRLSRQEIFNLLLEIRFFILLCFISNLV